MSHGSILRHQMGSWHETSSVCLLRNDACRPRTVGSAAGCRCCQAAPADPNPGFIAGGSSGDGCETLGVVVVTSSSGRSFLESPTLPAAGVPLSTGRVSGAPRRPVREATPAPKTSNEQPLPEAETGGLPPAGAGAGSTILNSGVNEADHERKRLQPRARIYCFSPSAGHR